MKENKKNRVPGLTEEQLEIVSGGINETQDQPDSDEIPRPEYTIPAIFMPVFGRHEKDQ